MAHLHDGVAMARLIIVSCMGVFCALALQGCNVSVPRHTIGNWEAKPNYLTVYEYTPPAVVGKTEAKAILNSCSDAAVSASLQCSGHGQCKEWNDLVQGANSAVPRLSFCECDRDWADPECKTPRKSQVTAFVLSLFFGIFGVDQFYLGYPWYGLLKLATLGGAGLWYLYDLCRIGSSPVVTRHSFRVAADLPHFAFVLTVITAMLIIGFLLAIRSIQQQRVKRAHELLLLRVDQQEAQEEKEEERRKEPQYSMAAPLRTTSFSGYGAMIPREMPTVLPRPAATGPVTTTLPPPPTTAVTTLPPVTLPPAPASRSFTPAPVATNLVPMTGPAPVFTNSVTNLASSMPPTEYSIPRAVATPPPTSPRGVTSPVLPVVQGISQPVIPATAVSAPVIRPVSSAINIPSQAPPPPTERVS